MKHTKIYLSGAISGLEKEEYEHNFRIAKKTVWNIFPEIWLSQIILPTEIKPLFGIHSWFFHMAADIFALLKCTNVAFQKNWIDSRGARIEMIVALITNKKIIML